MAIDKNIYTTWKWRNERKKFIASNPFCADHMRRGLKVVAVVVDHKIPHRGSEEIFWDRSQWQPLCKRCHDSHKQRLEKSGRIVGCDLKGVPLDPSHHWNM